MKGATYSSTKQFVHKTQGKKNTDVTCVVLAAFNLPKKLIQHKIEDHRWTQKVDDEDDD